MTVFKLPDLGEGLPEAEIVQWHVQVGDDIETDQLMVSMETAKAVVDVPSPQTGVIKALHGQSGDIIKTGAPLVEFEHHGRQDHDQGTVVGHIESSQSVLDESQTIHAPTHPSGQVKVTPAVRALAKKLGVDLSTVTPSGAKGLITTQDVKDHAQNRKSDHHYEALKGSRRAMAIAMTRSHQEVVPVTLTDDVILSPKSPHLKQITVSIVQAMVKAITAEPALNAWYESRSMTLCRHTHVNLGIAMDSPRGLYVPVIHQVNEKSPEAIVEIIKRYQDAIVKNSLDPQELKDATIVLSNFGSIGGKYANPVIIPPSVAILGLGRANQVPQLQAGQWIEQIQLPLSLSVDHRVVTGGEAARFLQVIKKELAET